jgi:hypothetical protein
MANTITRERCNYFLAHGMTFNRQLVSLLTGNKKTAKTRINQWQSQYE